jgi:hypothetical protein
MARTDPRAVVASLWAAQPERAAAAAESVRSLCDLVTLRTGLPIAAYGRSGAGGGGGGGMSTHVRPAVPWTAGGETGGVAGLPWLRVPLPHVEPLMDTAPSAARVRMAATGMPGAAAPVDPAHIEAHLAFAPSPRPATAPFSALTPGVHVDPLDGALEPLRQRCAAAGVGSAAASRSSLWGASAPSWPETVAPTRGAVAAHYDAHGVLAAEATGPRVPDSVVATRLADRVAGGRRDPRLAAAYHPTSRQLMASVAALGVGRQLAECERRAANRVSGSGVGVGRDPADVERLTWGRSLPAGHDSPWA